MYVVNVKKTPPCGAIMFNNSRVVNICKRQTVKKPLNNII